MRRLGALLALILALACATPAVAGEPAFPAPLASAIADAKQTMVADPAATLDSLKKAETLARGVSDPRQRTLALATVRWLGGEAQLRSDAPDKAAPLLAEGMRLIAPIREPIKLRGDLLMSQGALFMHRDRAAQALKSFQDAFRIFGQVREPRSQSIALQNIAALYHSANDDARAEQYYARAAEAFDGDPRLSLYLHNNRGNVLLSLERYAEADEEYGKALGIARELDNAQLEALVLVNVARLQAESGNPAVDATVARGLSLTGGESGGDMRRQFLATAARVAYDRKDYPRAARLIRQSFEGIDLATTSGEFRTAHLYAHRIFSAVGDARLALAHLEALKRINDESAKVATTTAAALMGAEFDYQGQQLKIQQLTTEQLRKTAEFQRTLFLSIGAATLVVIAALAWGLISIRRSRNKVRAANVELNDTNVALEKALRAKTEFLATTSHEIRTPLNGILGMTQVMLSDPKLEDETRDRIGIVHGAGVTMRALVDDILDLAKMETGNLTVDQAPMDLCATLREVTRMWEEQARAKGLGFDLQIADAPQWIVSDAGRMRQIIFNLLSNAIKFTQAGAITVRAAAEGEGDARRLRLAVGDTGIGIPADKREEIFESFKQADSGTTRKFGGTGLGLTICRNLARALGGDILVESAEGQGSTFTVDLPLVAAEAPAAEPGRGGDRLLILDRNPIARSMLKTLLEPRVGTLKFLATPDEALAALGEGADQLLVDEATLKAAGGDSFELLARLAAAAADAGAASAILHTKMEGDTHARLIASGVGQVIEKPVSGAALIAAIIPGAEEKSGGQGPRPLVSRAA